MYRSYSALFRISDADRSGLRLDGEPLPGTVQWKSVAGTDFVGAVVGISSGIHTMNNANGDFGLMIYGAGDKESYAMPVGMRLSPINVRFMDNLMQYTQYRQDF